MEHFAPEIWVAFARRELPPAEMAPIQSHLDHRCDECLRSSETWRMICEVLSREAKYQPPEDALREIKSAYILERPWRRLIQVARTAQLVFDSLHQPTLAMVRTGVTSSRQLVHEAEPYVVDLRLESEPARNRVIMTGQVLNSKDPSTPVSRVGVILLNGEDIVARTSAIASGEFNLEFNQSENLRLFISIYGERAIGIVLPDMAS